MNLDFSFSFGLKKSIKNFVFHNDDELLFAAGKFCVLFDFTSQTQKQFQFAEQSEVTALSKCSVLIAGALRGRPPSVCLINTLSDTKKIYVASPSMVSNEFIAVSVSTNLKIVAAQGGHPDWLLVFWVAQTKEILATFNPAQGPSSTVYDISFHKEDRDEIVVVGNGVFKLYEFQEENEDSEKPPFEEHVFEKFEKDLNFYSICWPQKANFAVSTSDGRILFFRGIELINEMSIANDGKDLFDICKEDVTSIVATEHHLICVLGGHVILVYSGEEIGRYKLAKFVSLLAEKSHLILLGEISEERDSIVNILSSPNDKNLIASTRYGQMTLWRNFDEANQPYCLSTILHQQHSDSIIGLDLAQGRPIIATASKNMIILWNYEDKNQELRKIFKDEITDITIHPTGLYIAVSFKNFFRVFSILYSILGERGYVSSDIGETSDTSKIRFSSGGHLLAVTSRHIIKIYSFHNLSLLAKLDGHAGTITSFDWNESDTVLVSCDIRGVICEWSIASHSKKWEVTAILSYSSVSLNSKTGNILAASTDSSIYCFKNSSLKWKKHCRKEPTFAAFFQDGKAFLSGTIDGCLEFYSSPESTGSFLTYAHCGKVTGLQFNSQYDVAVSCGIDGSIFLWKVSGKSSERNMNIFAGLTLVSSDHLTELELKLKQICLSIQHTDTASDCDLELSRIRHEKELRDVVLKHEDVVLDLNEKIARIKEEIQDITFDVDSKKDLIELDLAVKNEIIDTTAKLHDAYERSNAYATETYSIINEYEETIEDLGRKHAKFSYDEHNALEEITQKIKCLENTLSLEKGITKQALSAREKIKEETQAKIYREATFLKSSQGELLKEKKSKLAQLQYDAQRLKQLTAFQAEDTQNHQNIVSGQIDHDIKDKTDTIIALQKDFKRRENILEPKEKVLRKLERKFCEMREQVGSLHKRHSVSKTALEELQEGINLKESEIESCRKDITKIQTSVNDLQEEIRATEGLSLIVSKKLDESDEGFCKKDKVLQDTKEVLRKYFSLLRNILTKDYDPYRLVQEITTLFESKITDSTQEVQDPNLLQEFEYQIDKLKSSYDLIKEEPSKALRKKSMAELRLSRDNSEILREIRSAQKEDERLRLIINEMEMALGMHSGKNTKNIYELRDKIELVIDVSKRNEETKQKLSDLDALIEEQQKEISRLQTMLSDKANK